VCVRSSREKVSSLDRKALAAVVPVAVATLSSRVIALPQPATGENADLGVWIYAELADLTGA